MKILAALTRSRTPENKPRTSAVEWWRVISPLKAVAEKTGWQVDFVEAFKDFDRLKDYDLVWFSYMDNILAFREIVNSGVPFVVDFDDDFFNLGHFNPVRRQYPPGSDQLRSILHIIAHAPHISVSTSHLAKVYQKVRGANEAPFVLENRITSSSYEHGRVRFKLETPIRIGWQGGATHYADIFRTPFWGALTYLMGKYERLEFSAMGMYQDADWQDLPNFTWVEGSSDHPTFTQMMAKWARSVDIFVAPLEDTLFNASKSSIKIQECAIQRRPVVAANVQPYQEFAADCGGLVPLADSHKEWVDALEKLITDRRHRELTGQHLYDFIKEKYTIQSVVDEYIRYITSIVENHAAPAPAPVRKLNKKRLSILLANSSFSGLTGSELYYYELARELVNMGHLVTIAAPVIANPLMDKANRLGVEVITMNDLETLAPDVAIVSHVTSEIVATFTCPIIQVIHSENDALWPIERPIEGADHYVAVRESIRQRAIKAGLHPDKVTTIWNPIDVSRYQRKASNKTLLFVGPDDHLRKHVIRDLFNVAAKKGLTVKLVGRGQPNEPVWNVEKYVNNCEMTASIYMGRTTLEGWAAGKAGLIYEVDGEGNILSKRIVAPQPREKYDSAQVAQSILNLL